MNYLKRCLPVLFSIAVAAMAAAGDMPHAPRLAAGGGRVAGGFQVDSGENGTFELFAAGANGDDLRPLGRFHGQLAGVAVDGDGNCLALTRDGALGRYGDDVDTLAEPDSRWKMLGLIWFDNQPVAVANDGGQLFLVRLDRDGNWRQDVAPIARAGEATRVDSVLVEGRLHLVWNSRANDLSGGALRHATLSKGKWREGASLPLGDVSAFAAVAFRGEGAPLFAEAAGDGVAVFATRQDILTGEKRRVAGYVWSDGRWTRTRLSADASSSLGQAFSYAAAGDPDTGTAWLTAGSKGAFFTPAGAEPGSAAFRVGGEAAVQPVGVPQWGSLITFGAMLFLVVLYCRRSRALSRAFPGRPPDLFSRGAALMVDWFLVSFAMGAYHIANGDVRILPALLATGDVQGIFWANLGALILFTALAEGLYGCTPGKYLAGLRVRSVLGGRPAFLQAVLRNMLRVVDMFPLPIAFPGLLGVIATLFGPRRQRVGDIMAATIVRRHLPLGKRKFFLASASPRRLELLHTLGLDVRPEAMDIDEDSVEGKTADETVVLLAQKKVQAATGSVRAGEVVVAADTVVVLDGDILGKPVDADEARGMLRRLSGRSHSVFTGVAVWDSLTGQALSDVDETEVEFRVLSDREIDEYVASGDPMDKAGAYGVQSGFLVKQVRGSLSNVAGLPMEKLQGMLMQLDT